VDIFGGHYSVYYPLQDLGIPLPLSLPFHHLFLVPLFHSHVLAIPWIVTRNLLIGVFAVTISSSCKKKLYIYVYVCVYIYSTDNCLVTSLTSFKSFAQISPSQWGSIWLPSAMSHPPIFFTPCFISSFLMALFIF